MYNCFIILHQHRLDTDLFDLRGDDGEVGLHVPVQKVGHHHTVGDHVDHDVMDAGEKLGLNQQFYKSFSLSNKFNLFIRYPY